MGPAADSGCPADCFRVARGLLPWARQLDFYLARCLALVSTSVTLLLILDDFFKSNYSAMALFERLVDFFERPQLKEQDVTSKKTETGIIFFQLFQNIAMNVD